jgi:hypothetical protein
MPDGFLEFPGRNVGTKPPIEWLRVTYSQRTDSGVYEEFSGRFLVCVDGKVSIAKFIKRSKAGGGYYSGYWEGIQEVDWWMRLPPAHE